MADAARAGLLPNLVVDPVLVSTSGHRLGVVEAVERLLPYALVATPNRAEAAALLGWPVTTVRRRWRGRPGSSPSGGPRYVVVTGGDAGATGTGREPDAAVDVLWTGSEVRLLRGPWVPTRNTHGTGCSFSAAIAARLALGDAVPDARGRRQGVRQPGAARRPGDWDSAAVTGRWTTSAGPAETTEEDPRGPTAGRWKPSMSSPQGVRRGTPPGSSGCPSPRCG